MERGDSMKLRDMETPILALAEKAFRDHAATCSYYDWEPEACPICKRLIRARDEARRRALTAGDIVDYDEMMHRQQRRIIAMTTTYRAAYWTDGKAEIVLTLPEHAHLSDDDLLAEAMAEAERQGMDLSYGQIVIGVWTE